jgi:hypothetical protein
VLATLLSHLRRFEGRPRKIAALACLVMAAISALHHSPASRHATVQPTTGEVAMSLVLADGGAAQQFLRAGDRVDLLSDTENLRLRDVLVLDVTESNHSQSLLSSAGSANFHGGGSALVVAVRTADITKATALASHLVYATPHDSR